MNPFIISVILMLFAAVFGSAANVLLKLGTRKKLRITSLFTDVYLFSGLILHGLAGVSGIIAYKWGDLSILFPIGAFSYVLTLLLAKYILHENLNAYKVIAIIFIILGIMVTIV